jgi:hypothetical protein
MLVKMANKLFIAGRDIELLFSLKREETTLLDNNGLNWTIIGSSLRVFYHMYKLLSLEHLVVDGRDIKKVVNG